MNSLNTAKTISRRKRAARQALPLTPPNPAEEDLQCFFANALGMLCVAGFDGFFKRLNPEWKTTLGWTLEELQSKPFLEFVHPDDRALTRSEVEILVGGGRTVAFENRYRCKDGSYKWLQWNSTALPERQQVYALAQDVTVARRLEAEVLTAIDLEKDRLGRELHDGLCQNLAGIAALSTALSRKLSGRVKSQAADAREITRLLNETIGHARDMAQGLNPLHLEHTGLGTALQNLAANVQDLFHLSCTLQSVDPFPALDPAAELHLYRVVQEAVNNAITHGRAKRIRIRIETKIDNLIVSIRDNGGGITASALSAKGAGLHTMEYRSRLIGATLKIQRRRPRGTTVTCTVPLPTN